MYMRRLDWVHVLFVADSLRDKSRCMPTTRHLDVHWLLAVLGLRGILCQRSHIGGDLEGVTVSRHPKQRTGVPQPPGFPMTCFIWKKTFELRTKRVNSCDDM